MTAPVYTCTRCKVDHLAPPAHTHTRSRDGVVLATVCAACNSWCPACLAIVAQEHAAARQRLDAPPRPNR